jgi:hypothetical protein
MSAGAIMDEEDWGKEIVEGSSISGSESESSPTRAWDMALETTVWKREASDSGMMPNKSISQVIFRAGIDWKSFSVESNLWKHNWRNSCQGSPG